VTCRRPAERRLRVRFVQLAENPFDLRLSTPLTERAGVRRSRVGGWRILFSAAPMRRSSTCSQWTPEVRFTNTPDDLERPAKLSRPVRRGARPLVPIRSGKRPHDPNPRESAVAERFRDRPNHATPAYGLRSKSGRLISPSRPGIVRLQSSTTVLVLNRHDGP